MALMDAESQYTQGGMLTTARTPGFEMAGLDPMSNQLMALLNPALDFKRQQAMQSMALANRAANRDDSALAFDQSMRQKAWQQSQQERALARQDAELAQRQSFMDRRKSEAMDARQRGIEEQGEEVYGQTAGGINSMPGFVIGTGSPGAHGFGFAGRRRKGSGFGVTEGGSMQGGAGPEGPVRNTLAEEAERQRGINSMGTSSGRLADTPGFGSGGFQDFENFRAPRVSKGR